MSAPALVVEGVDDLLEILKGLDEDMRGEVVQEGMLRGAEIVAAEAAARAPHGESGELAASIRAEKREQSFFKLDPGDSTAVGVRAAWYWRFPEFGVAPHEIGKGWTGWHPGMPATPFARPALDENADRVLSEVADAIRSAAEARTR